MEEKVDIEIDDETLAMLQIIAEKEGIPVEEVIKRFVLRFRRMNHRLD